MAKKKKWKQGVRSGKVFISDKERLMIDQAFVKSRVETVLRDIDEQIRKSKAAAHMLVQHSMALGLGMSGGGEYIKFFRGMTQGLVEAKGIVNTVMGLPCSG